MEPEWMSKINSSTICSFYYAFFVAYAVIALIAVIGLIMILASKISLDKKLYVAFNSLITIALGVTLALFQYMVCDRALLSNEVRRAELQVQ
jgi:cell division protein FtsW (lipid II flippase)